ncbi:MULTISPECIES: hypothetical protein [unclassified Actinomyces]|uniref:hypothetical protein n=1 Tax=unclassified Actinomyces TaxID=2609248 RepID=UPI00190052F9|nr:MULTISPECIES: hypothetical protein [unclassified Actinomyces]
MTGTAKTNPAPAALPDSHGFRHALGAEDPGAVAKQYPPSPARDDHAEAGALLLEALTSRDQHGADLASQAVVVVTQADPRASRSDIERVVNGYRDLAREARTIPYDPAMVDGVLRYGSLRPVTRRAWLGAAAAVARGL